MLNNGVFSLEEIAKIKVSDDKESQLLLNELLKEAEEAVDKEGQQSVTLLALAYYITEDIKYFEKAKKDVLDLCAEKCWTPGGLHGGAFQGRCELVSARKGNHAASFYSLFGDLLSEEERSLLIKNTYEKSIALIYEDWVKHDTRIHALDTMGHNWWIVVVSSGAYQALLMKDEIPFGDQIVAESIKCCEAWFKYSGNHVNMKPSNTDNGAFWEGYSYLNYSLSEYMNFASAYKRIFGEHPFDDTEILKKYADYFMAVYYPAVNEDYFINFGDSGCGTSPVNCLWDYIAYGLDFPEVLWYLKRNKHSDEAKLTRLMLADKMKKADESPAKLNVCYDEVGIAIFRESYEDNGELLAVKCGDTWNHAHADAGHFSFYKNGVQEIFDAGCTGSYSVQSYQGYYVQSIGHNTVLFNDQGQDKRDNYKDHVKLPGKLYNFTEKEGFRYVLADCTGPMSRYFRKHHRHFLWIDRCILIYDDIECYEKGTVNFLLHGEENNSFIMLSPSTVRSIQGYKNSSDTFNCEYRSYDINTAVEDHAKIVSCISLDKDITPLYEEFDDYIKVSYGETIFYINKLSDGRVMHNNCIIKPDNYTTDAVILVENKGKTGVVNGSIVRKENKTIFGEWARINGYIN